MSRIKLERAMRNARLTGGVKRYMIEKAAVDFRGGEMSEEKTGVAMIQSS